MKKYLMMFLCVLGFSLLFASKVEAKSDIQDNVKITFGGEETLNLIYSSVNTYRLYSDNSFYFDGVKHTFNGDYTLLDKSISVENNTFILNGDTFTLDVAKKEISSSKSYEAYSFPVDIEFLNDNKNTYTFKQQLCYKYTGLDEVKCDIDSGDINELSESVSYSYYYDFLPFYKEELKFEELTYKFSLTRGETTFIFNDLTFTRDNIQYQDYFEIGKWDYQNTFNWEYNGNNYITISQLFDLFGNFLGNYIAASFATGYVTSEIRTYEINFFICVGRDYSSCSKVLDSTLASNQGYGYPIPLDSVINFTYQDNLLTADIHDFLLKGSYVCSQNCTDARAQTRETYTNEIIFHLDLQDPSYKGEAKGKRVYCNTSGNEMCLGINEAITNRVYFEDDNGILEVYYYISSKILNNDELTLINNPIDNGGDLRLDLEEGIYYLYLRVLDGSGNYSALWYRYLVDKSGPTLANNNFSNYLSEGVYNKTSLEVNYSDTYSRNITDIYFLITSESDYPSVNKEAIISANNLYSGGVNLADYASEDGLYRVCFIARDALDNYSEISCTNAIYLDKTPLTREEVEVSEGNTNYQRSIELMISLSQIDEEVEFKCGLFLKEIESVSEEMLTSTCKNKVNNVLTSEGEGEYRLWIYASDKAGNYSLLQFPYIYLVDNLAPRVSYLIEGNNHEYSNNVHLNVSVNDLNTIDYSSLSYQFYLTNYNESEFVTFNLEEGINYPFDYYGNYKIAIKTCDLLTNCKVNTFSDEFLIDTGEIKLELVGDASITIFKWGRYKELGARATKGNRGDNVKELEYQISGEVNKNKVGVYYLTYSSGEGMNKVKVTREVIVKDSLPYLIISFGVVIIGEAIIVSRLFIKRKKHDNI